MVHDISDVTPLILEEKGSAAKKSLATYTNDHQPLSLTDQSVMGKQRKEQSGPSGSALVGVGSVQAGGTGRDLRFAGNHEGSLENHQAVLKPTSLGHASVPNPLQQIMEERGPSCHHSAGYCDPMADITGIGMSISSRSSLADWCVDRSTCTSSFMSQSHQASRLFCRNELSETFRHVALPHAEAMILAGSTCFEPTADRHLLMQPKPSNAPHAPTEPNDPPLRVYHPCFPTDRHATVRSTVTQRPRQHIYDRPGRRPVAEYEPDITKLAAAHALGGGTAFAVAWIHKVFKDGVTLPALVRVLTPEERGEMGFTGGFTPLHAYDGFLEKNEDGFQCGLCREDKRTYWKCKKDAARHLRKFHFGLADKCIGW